MPEPSWSLHTFPVLVQVEADTREQARKALENELWESFGRFYFVQDDAIDPAHIDGSVP